MYPVEPWQFQGEVFGKTSFMGKSSYTPVKQSVWLMALVLPLPAWQ
jgi:hypothetical protein